MHLSRSFLLLAQMGGPMSSLIQPPNGERKLGMLEVPFIQKVCYMNFYKILLSPKGSNAWHNITLTPPLQCLSIYKNKVIQKLSGKYLDQFSFYVLFCEK